jgi:hypothetical protein
MDGEAHLKKIIEQYAQLYPPTVTVKQACEIGHCDPETIYFWSKSGELDEFKSKRGRSMILGRDAFVKFLFTAAPEINI